MAFTSSTVDHPHRWSVLVFVPAYLLATILSEHAYGTLAVPSPFWLPDAVLLWTLLVLPRDRWWMVLAAMWPVRLVAGAVPGTPLWFQVVTIANDAGKAAGGAWLIRHFGGGRAARLATLNDLLVFFGVAAFAMPLLSAIAITPAWIARGQPVWPAAYRWFIGDALAQVVVTPTLLYWWHGGYRQVRSRLAEVVIVAAGTIATTTYVFVLDADGLHALPLMYLPVPFLIWKAVRLPPFSTATAITLVAVASMIGAVENTGVFAGGVTVTSLQCSLLVLGVTLLTLAVVIDERAALLARQRQFSWQLTQAQDRERTRIARDVHDDLVQQLTVLTYDLHRVASVVDGPAAVVVADATRRADTLAAGLRDLSHSLHPTRLRVLGLVPALEGLVDELSNRGPRLTFTRGALPTALPDDVATTAFRVAQEALHNAIKHGRAATVTLQLGRSRWGLSLTIEDDGAGFVMDGPSGDGLGLVSMRERVQAIGGTLTIESSPGRGTTITALLPVPHEAAGDTPVA